MQPLKVGHVYVHILDLSMMLLFWFWYKRNHSLDTKYNVVVVGVCLRVRPGTDFRKRTKNKATTYCNTDPCLCELRLIRYLVEGSGGIFESTSWGDKSSYSVNLYTFIDKDRICLLIKETYLAIFQLHVTSDIHNWQSIRPETKDERVSRFRSHINR